MPLSSSLVGTRTGPRTVAVTARLTMAYAAALSDLNPRYLDDTRKGGIVAPPLFGVRLDWPIRPFLPGAGGLTSEESRRGVHATHDLQFHRAIRPGDQLITSGRVVQVEQRSPGAYLLTRYDTVDSDGAAVLTTWYGSLFRGVAVEGAAATLDAPPPLPRPASIEINTSGNWTAEIPISPALPHIYTECADIWNPIHTERTVALAAGLPDTILHGTATHALAAREIVERECAGDPIRLIRIACRFGAMVQVNTTIRISLAGRTPCPEGETVFFTVTNAEGDPAIRDGMAIIR